MLYLWASVNVRCNDKTSFMRLLLAFALLLESPLCTVAQQPILWNNPSFEDEPAHSHPPRGWYYCDGPGESPPDTHPGGFFGVSQTPYDGRTYLGMVARDNGTTEGVGQRLPGLMAPGQCYVLRYYATRSPAYESISRTSGQPEPFNTPVMLQLWGGMYNCDKAVLLAQSPAVASTEWEKFQLAFQVQQPFTHLFLEVAHVDGGEWYNGNVLVDQLSPILPVDCETGDVLASIASASKPKAASFEEAEVQINQLLEAVRIGPDGGLPERVVRQPNGDYVQVNLPLWQIGRLMQQLPGRQLQVGVAGQHSRSALEQLQRQVWYSLRASGLPEDQFKIKGRARGNRWEGSGPLRYALK